MTTPVCTVRRCDLLGRRHWTLGRSMRTSPTRTCLARGCTFTAVYTTPTTGMGRWVYRTPLHLCRRHNSRRSRPYHHRHLCCHHRLHRRCSPSCHLLHCHPRCVQHRRQHRPQRCKQSAHSHQLCRNRLRCESGWLRRWVCYSVWGCSCAASTVATAATVLSNAEPLLDSRSR